MNCCSRIKAVAIFLLFFAGILVSEVTAGSIVYQKRRYESVYDLAARYGLKVAAWNGKVVLYDKTRRVELRPDKRELEINRVRHYFNFAAVARGGTFVSQFDMLTLLDPILREQSLSKRRCKVIVIDPGHGGKDSGARGKHYLEKRVTLELAQNLKRLLERSGYKVYMTRTGDVYVPLVRRAQVANWRKADLFISLHVNAAQDKSVSGLETYALTPDGAPSTSSSQVVWTRYSGNANELNNLALAHSIQQQMLKKTKAKDRGVKRARFVVLREVKCPAVLVEVGFISNYAEERKLGSRSYLDALARGIADGVLRYHRAILRGK